MSAHRPLTRAEALARVLRHSKTLGTETVPLSRAAGRVLRASVKTDRPIPPFHRAAMDGFAVRSVDLSRSPSAFSVVSSIPAGTMWEGRIRAGQAARIMTGAPLPGGADTIVPLEESRSLGPERVRLHPQETERGANVHHRGSDAPRGRAALRPGRILTGLDVAALASFGTTSVTVSEPVQVHLLNTGREVVRPSDEPRPWEIRNANGPGLSALFQPPQWARCRFAGIAPDREEALERKVRKTMQGCHVLVITGGVSRGDYDFVPAVLGRTGARKVFHRIGMRPGRPLWFGKGPDGLLVFGVPGNPVSNFVTAHEFLFPALRKKAGAKPAGPRTLHLPLVRDWSKRHFWEEARVARLVSGPDGTSAVDPIDYQGSGDFLGALPSDGLAFLPAGEQRFQRSMPVEFHPWRFQA